MMVEDVKTCSDNTGKVSVDVAIVGGGPIGLALGRSLADRGFSVVVCEEHVAVGKPVQCAGLVSERAFSFSGLSMESVVHEVSEARVVSPGGFELRLGPSKKKMCVIDRHLFDREMAENFVRSGGMLRVSSRVVGFLPSDLGESGVVGLEYLGVSRSGMTSRSFARVVVGADGVFSAVRKRFFRNTKRRILGAVEVEGFCEHDDVVTIVLERRVAPGFFLWKIPSGERRARIGLAFSPPRPGPLDRPYFGYGSTAFENLVEFIKKDSDTLGVWGFRPAHLISGAIPISPPLPSAAGNVLLVGDAAGHVKATSGGGIVMGLRGAIHAAKAIEDFLDGRELLEKYDDLWMGDIGRELLVDYVLHRTFFCASDAEVDHMMELFGSKSNLSILNRLGDVDYPSRLIAPLLVRNPWLLRLLPRFMRNLFETKREFYRTFRKQQRPYSV